MSGLKHRRGGRFSALALLRQELRDLRGWILRSELLHPEDIAATKAPPKRQLFEMIAGASHFQQPLLGVLATLKHSKTIE